MIDDSNAGGEGPRIHDGGGRTRWRSAARALAVGFVVNALGPSLLFFLLSSRHVATIQALLVTAVFPTAGTLVTWARARRIDGMGTISLLVIAVGVVVSLASGNARLYLVKDSFLTGTFAAVCLASLLLPRPLVFPVWRHFATAGDPEASAGWDAHWQDPAFRRLMRVITLAWGGAFGADAVLRVPLALYAPPGLVLLVNPVLTIAIVVLLAAWMTSSWRAWRTSARLAVEPAAAVGDR